MNAVVFWSKCVLFSVFCSIFFRKGGVMDRTVLSFGQKFLKRQYELNLIVFWLKFSWKTIWVEPYCFLVKMFLKDNMGWTVLSFIEDFLKRQYELNHIVFCSRFSRRAKWVDPYRLLIKIFQKDYMDWTALSCQ